MKNILILGALFLVTPLRADNAVLHGDFFNEVKICEQCKKDGKKSSVYKGESVTYAVYCGDGHWDENGNYIPPPFNCGGGDTYYWCSRGHSWKEITNGGEESIVWIETNPVTDQDYLDKGKDAAKRIREIGEGKR